MPQHREKSRRQQFPLPKDAILAGGRFQELSSILRLGILTTHLKGWVHPGTLLRAYSLHTRPYSSTSKLLIHNDVILDQ